MEIDNMNTEERRQNELLVRRDSIQKEFQGYYFDENKSPKNGNKKIVEPPTIALHK